MLLNELSLKWIDYLEWKRDNDEHARRVNFFIVSHSTDLDFRRLAIHPSILIQLATRW